MHEAKSGGSILRRHEGWRACVVGGAIAIASLAVPLTANAATPKITHGGIIKEALDAFPVGLSPTQVPVINVDGQQQMEAIYGLLADENAKTGAVQLVFLKSITPSNNFKTWDLTLHSGIKFSDGTLLNAAAIEYTINQLANPKNAYEYQAAMTGWKLKVLSTYELQITLPGEDAQFPAEMTQDFPFIASPTAWAAEGTKFSTKPVGAGAFTLKSFTANASMTLVANPHYWISGEPYVSEIVVSNFPTSHTQLVNSLTTGENNLAWLQGKSQVDPVAAAGLHVQNFPLGGGLWLAFNTQKPPFNNLLARQAVNIALSHQQLANSWAPGSTAMTEMFPAGSTFYDPASVNPPENNTKAQADFNELAKEGHPLDFTITDLTGYEGIAQYVQSHLATYKNVKVKISMVQGPQYVSESLNDTFQMIPQGFYFPAAAPWPTLSEGVLAGSSQNYGRWNDPKVNSAIANLKTTTSLSQEKKDWNIVLAEIHAQAPFFTAQAALLTTVYAKNLHNVNIIEAGTLPLMEQIYIS